jgi:hypothetical protein
MMEGWNNGIMEVRSSIIRASNYLDERYYPVSHHLFQAILFAAILIAAWFSSVQSGHISIFGYTIPSLCMFKNITTLDCPGCGITRSFVFAFHGKWYESYIMHFWGIPLALFLVFQVGYRFWRASGGSPLKFNPTFTRWFRIFVVLSILLPWLGKIVITLLSGYTS